jgi:hypothetical protein
LCSGCSGIGGIRALRVRFRRVHRRTRHKKGLLELAEGGSILLNEIGELSLGLQAKLLTFLDTRQFTRVGPFLTEISRRFFTPEGLPNIRSIVFGAIMIGIVIFEPLGMNGIYLRIKRYWKRWPF